MERTDAQLQTPTALAFIGDAVMSLFVRKALLSRGGGNTLHVAASRYVNATAQAFVFDVLTDRGFFTQEESDIARRARNAHLHSRAKAATPSEYHKATALEAVIGYLELTGDTARRDCLLDMCVEITDSNNF